MENKYYIGITVLVLIVSIVIGVVVWNASGNEEKHRIDHFLKSDKVKLHNVKISKEEFDQLQSTEKLFYFPSTVPEYKEDILLVIDTPFGQRWYLPETETLIKLPCSVKWTREFTGEYYRNDCKQK